MIPLFGNNKKITSQYTNMSGILYLYPKMHAPSFHQKQTVALHKSRIMFIWFSLLGKSPKSSPPILWLRRSGWPGERSSRTSCSPSRGSRRSGGRRRGRTATPQPWWSSPARNVRDPENLSRGEIPRRLPVNNPWTRCIQGKILLAQYLERIKFQQKF